MDLNSIGERAKASSRWLCGKKATEKNKILEIAANALIAGCDEILNANAKDMAEGESNGLTAALLDRLALNPKRVEGMAEGLRSVAALPDPIGETLSMKTMDNGLVIGKKRVPIGVIGIIYEARPNVTSDAFALCCKSGNAVILKGGKEAIHSNTAIVDVIQKALAKCGMCADIVQIITDTSRESTKSLMRLNKYVDVLIPRGGAGLIQAVVENSSVPVIETGVGNCHIYVDETADVDMAKSIIVNAKAQRPGVCNSCETVLVQRSIATRAIPAIAAELAKNNVEMRGDDEAIKIYDGIIPAVSSDWATEYLDYIIAIKVVADIDEAIAHISRYGTGHSEAIITESYANSQRFLHEVDAAAVYVNASTRFTDGAEFGMGAEIGISTQKLHARGPMGLAELTSTKYVIFGSGQIRM